MVNVVDVVRRLVEERNASDRTKVELPAEARVRSDPFQLRFVLDNFLAALLAEAGERGSIAIQSEGGALALQVRAAQGAIAKLHRFSAVEREPVSWRVVLARAVATRNGWDVDVDATADGMTVRCRPPGGVETRGSTEQ
jgi:hypothetical protein